MKNIYKNILVILLILGTISTAIALGDTMPIITGIGNVGITDTSAEITFTVDQTRTNAIIYYGTTDNNLDENSSWNNKPSRSKVITLSGLSSGTTYYFSIHVCNRNNNSLCADSDILNFTTDSPSPGTSSVAAPSISDVNAINITNTSVDITFSINQSDAHTRVYYGTTKSSLSTRSSWNNETDLTTRTITLSGLTGGKKYFYQVHAYNGTDPNHNSMSEIRNFTTSSNPTVNTNASPKIVSTSPGQTIRTTGNEQVNFTATFDQIVDIKWYINNTKVKTENSVTSSYYLNNTPSVGTWNVTVKGTNSSETISYSWTWIVNSEGYTTGNRIWDATKGMSTTYKWTPQSFSGFYYNIDSNLGTEKLTIQNIKRTIDEGDIIYSTSPINIHFDYSDFGKYQLIGFMADKYFAGYTENSSISGNKEISVIGNGQLHKILIDDEDKRVIYVGSTLSLKEGYVLKAKEVDVGAGPGQIWISLLKDGNEVDNDVVAGGGTYIYSKKVGVVDSLPIIAVRVDNVFRGTEANAAFIKGVFQISDSYTQIRTGDKYGMMEISEVNRDKITMTNEGSVSLSARSTVDLMGDMKIIVADSDTLRFALSVKRSGTFEVRGTIYPIVQEWTPLNFGLDIGGRNVGFYYDVDEDIGTEKLKIEGNISGTSIPEGKLIYSTSPQEVSFDYSNFGKYDVIGFMADKYFAGYTKNSSISENKEIDVIGNGQLHKILVDDEDKRVISVGSTLSLKEGYVLKAKEVDVGAGTGQIWFVLLKDGNEVDNDVVASGDSYVYSKKTGVVDGLPIIAVHIDSVFRGTEVNAAFIKGIFQISDSYTNIKSGNTYGIMEISSISNNQIIMENKNDIGLSPGNKIDIMGDIKFRVADSSNLRFYPYVSVTQDMIANQLKINIPNKATAGDTISINVTAGGTPIEGASISIGPEIGDLDRQTNDNGTVDFIFPIKSKGIYTVTATKLGYEDANKTIDIQPYIENKLSINAPTMADQYKEISIQITSNNMSISGVMIEYDNETIGKTNSNGILNYTLQSSGTHTIKASKSGYVPVSREIEVKAPYSDFKALDISIIPNSTFEDEKILIKSNITNVGTMKDAKSIDLIINDTIVDNMSITLAPNDKKEINFTYKTSIPVGNYTVKILEQKELLEVKKSQPSIVLIGIILTVIGVIIIYALTPKDKMKNIGDIGSIGKIKELIRGKFKR